MRMGTHMQDVRRCKNVYTFFYLRLAKGNPFGNPRHFARTAAPRSRRGFSAKTDTRRTAVTGHRETAPEPSQGDTLKDKLILIRITEQERAALKQLAEKAGLTVSEYARERLLYSDREYAKAHSVPFQKSETENRHGITIPTKFSPAEIAWLDERAKWMGCSRSTAIRKLVLCNGDVQPIVIDTKALQDTYYELRKQGVNLNQLMTYLNTYKRSADTESVEQTLAKVNDMLTKMGTIINSLKAQKGK